MEELNNLESFENFKNRIGEIFKNERLSENLNLEIGKWHNRRWQETDAEGSTIEQKVRFQMELAEISGVIEKYDDVYNTLADAWTYAYKAGLPDLAKEIEDLMDSILGKK